MSDITSVQQCCGFDEEHFFGIGEDKAQVSCKILNPLVRKNVKIPDSFMRQEKISTM